MKSVFFDNLFSDKTIKNTKRYYEMKISGSFQLTSDAIFAQNSKKKKKKKKHAIILHI